MEDLEHFWRELRGEQSLEETDTLFPIVLVVWTNEILCKHHRCGKFFKMSLNTELFKSE